VWTQGYLLDGGKPVFDEKEKENQNEGVE